MRINDGYRVNQDAIESARQGGAAGKAAPTSGDSTANPAAGGGGETVTVSVQAQQLADRAAATAESTKVTQLQNAIADGSFKPNPQVIANRIVEGG